MLMKIAIGADHAGFELKETLRSSLKEYQLKDFGTYSAASVDYPDFAHPVASAVENAEFDFGILICGSGNGIAITANKHQGIRAAICWNTELAALARKHNNANILCLPARFISIKEAWEITETFLQTEFEDSRHVVRVNKIAC